MNNNSHFFEFTYEKNEILYNATLVHSSYGEMLNPSLALFLFQPLLILGEVINDPTIKPTKDFSACKDAKVLVNADSKQISNILYHRTFDERKQIEKCFNTKYASQSALSFVGGIQLTKESDLNSLNLLALVAPEQMLGDTIHDAITSKGGSVGDIEEVVCANDKQMKDRIDKYYQSKYQTTVAKHLATFRSGDKDYQDVMQKYCWSGLCQDKKITPQDADKEAQALRDIHAKKHKADFKKKLKELLDKYCEPDMKLIFQKYRHGDNGIEKAVSDAFTVDRQWRAYFKLVKYIEDVCKFYAFELRHAADDSTDIYYDKINRIVLTRSERDLFCIAKAYPSQDQRFKTFTSRLSNKQGWRQFHFGGLGSNAQIEHLYVESIRYLLGKP